MDPLEVVAIQAKARGKTLIGFGQTLTWGSAVDVEEGTWEHPTFSAVNAPMRLNLVRFHFCGWLQPLAMGSSPTNMGSEESGAS